MSTMDDNATDAAAERTLTIKIGEREFPAKPFSQGQIMALTMVKGMKPTAVFSVLSGLVKSSLGEDAQGEVLVMLATQEIDEHQLIGILGDVVKAAQEQKDVAEDVPATFGNGG